MSLTYIEKVRANKAAAIQVMRSGGDMEKFMAATYQNKKEPVVEINYVSPISAESPVQNDSPNIDPSAVAEMQTLPEGSTVLAAEKADDGTLAAITQDAAGNLQCTVEVHGASSLLYSGADGQWHSTPEAAAQAAAVITEAPTEAPAEVVAAEPVLPEGAIQGKRPSGRADQMSQAWERANNRRNNKRRG